MAKVINLWEECARRTGYNNPAFVPVEEPSEKEKQEFYKYMEQMECIEQHSKIMKYMYNSMDLLIREVNYLKSEVEALRKKELSNG
ncbi:MAG: hypothetical protein LBJ80_00185 [Rickettsiales bacterium]|jgi:hypothetical protein|nr:hypothetical protein [Rickettsiales bacterium]